jgi:hypothetical protein
MPNLVVKRPFLDPEVVEVDDLGYETFQDLVGGTIDAVQLPLPEGSRTLSLYVHDEGLMSGLQPNVINPADPHSLLVGPVVFSACDEDGEEVPLTETEIALGVTLLKELALSVEDVTTMLMTAHMQSETT